MTTPARLVEELTDLVWSYRGGQTVTAGELRQSRGRAAEKIERLIAEAYPPVAEATELLCEAVDYYADSCSLCSQQVEVYAALQSLLAAQPNTVSFEAQEGGHTSTAYFQDPESAAQRGPGWTKEQPTKPGWYEIRGVKLETWANDFVDGGYVYLKKHRGKLYAIHYGEEAINEWHDAEWCGPLAVPHA